MILRPQVHPEAEAEFLDAARYYETTQAGLGDEFDTEVTKAVDYIQWNPEAWPTFPGWDRLPVVRSRKVDVFPYRVVYFVRDDVLLIVAFAHQSRHPGYWKNRVDP
ncbi:type II toxin-antitoxin system RelE/ParE family toxin [Microbacterium luticocti]|uniref:type II toxin-antitoxin system RelE/ParE family toxin n=1 Tax=Microbacterium luticocti TaxID=451764 RepID=UPI00041815A2|nr:type II toxin-antitoxin system RelE/ParE family toxin [Microbacterium luticocti]